MPENCQVTITGRSVFRRNGKNTNTRYSQSSISNLFQFRLKLNRCRSRHDSTKLRNNGDLNTFQFTSLTPSSEQRLTSSNPTRFFSMYKKVGDNFSRNKINGLSENKGDADDGPMPVTFRKVHGYYFRIRKKQRADETFMQSMSNQSSMSGLKIQSSDFPTVRFISGKRVTIVDEKLKVFVIDLLNPETCELVRKMTDDHVRKVHDDGNRVPTWRTLYTYTKQDLPCCEVKNLSEQVTNSITESVKDVVGEICNNKIEAAKLRERSWKEPHLLLYQHLEGKPLHTGVDMHYDGCHISWICMLSKSGDYEGGGTYIRALKMTIKLKQGQVLVFPGELYHKGCDITNGVRAMIVCFLDGFDPEVTDPSSYKTDKEEWQNNVVTY